MIYQQKIFTKEECDELTLHRYQQYLTALEDNCAFQKRYMQPVDIKISKKNFSISKKSKTIKLVTLRS